MGVCYFSEQTLVVLRVVDFQTWSTFRVYCKGLGRLVRIYRLDTILIYNYVHA